MTQGAKSLTLVWLVAFAMAVVTILLLTSPLKITLPMPPKVPLDVDIVVGSSLSKTLLPTYEKLPSLLQKDRDIEVITVAGATAKETLEMLDWAIHHTQGDVFVEANALTLQFTHRAHPLFPWLTAILEGQPAHAAEIAAKMKRLLGMSRKEKSPTATLGRSSNFSLVNNGRPTRGLSYSPQAFLYSRELRVQIAQLESAQRRLILIWPPVPEGGTGADIGSWQRARNHVVLFCSQFQVECWLPDSPWPNHFFIDFWGHLGPIGRDRFALVFSEWLRELR